MSVNVLKLLSDLDAAATPAPWQWTTQHAIMAGTVDVAGGDYSSAIYCEETNMRLIITCRNHIREIILALDTAEGALRVCIDRFDIAGDRPSPSCELALARINSLKNKVQL